MQLCNVLDHSILKLKSLWRKTAVYGSVPVFDTELDTN